MINKDEFTV